MKFLGIRHGQSEYNIKQLCNDDPDKQIPLTQLGQQQAKEVGHKLIAENISIIYCSPLLRTIQTAEIINQVLKRPLIIESRLCDIHTGFDSQPIADYLAFIADNPLHAKVKGNESLTDHFLRITEFLNELQSKHPEPVLLVAHEETLRVFKAWSENLPLLQVLGLPYQNCQAYTFNKISLASYP